MADTTSMEMAVDLLFEGGDVETVKDIMLTENAEEQIVRQLGEVTFLNYLLKFEEYLDDHDVYAFPGWEDAHVVSKPKIDKFWTRFYLHVGKDTDLRGAKRITNDKEGQNQVQYKKLEDGTYIVKFKILKRYLDQIEQRNKEKAEELSNEEVSKSDDDPIS